LGLIFSVGPLLQFTFGLFIKPASQAFHANRGSVSMSLLVALCLSGSLTPIVGRLVDRSGVRRFGVPVIILFSISIALIGLASTSLRMFLLCYALASIFSAAQTPLIYAKAITYSLELA
jgi:MFS family permease